MPGYYVADVPITQQRILQVKFYGKPVLNEEIRVNKYWKQIKHMSKFTGMMFDKFILLKSVNCGLWVRL